MDRIIVEYLANALWQVPLLVGAVAALLWAMGAEVRTRHQAWLAVLVVAMLMPLRGMQLPEISDPDPMPVENSFTPVTHPYVEAAPWTAAVMSPDHAITPVSAEKPHMPLLVFGDVSGRWLVRLYAAFLAFAAWRIGRSWIAARQLLQRSRSIDLAPRAMAIFAQAAQHQDVALPRLRQSDETISPVVIGARRPVLLLPAGFDQLKDDEILAALSHEFAHLKRRDYLVNIICQLASLPLLWHPAIHYVHKRIRDTREMLCDAAAAQEMASPVRYATCLVAFALRALDGRDAALATQGLSMFDNRILEERILHLTQAPEEPEPSTRMARLACAAIGLVMAVTMALLFHVTPTWAESPSAIAAEPPVAPVPLTPQVDLPAVPPAPAEPAAPAAPAVVPTPDMQRAINEESRQRTVHPLSADDAQRKRDEAQRKRDEAQRKLDEKQALRDMEQHKRDMEQHARDMEQHDRDMKLAQHEIEKAQREGAREAERAKREVERAQRDATREAEQAQREAAQEAAEAAREATQANREAIHEAEHQAAEAKRLADQIKRQVANATSYVRSPEFQAQMSQLHDHMQELHDQMAELGQRMKDLDKEASRNN